MKMNRKRFIKRSCMAGAIACGFGSIAFAGGKNEEASNTLENEDENRNLLQAYIAQIISEMDFNMDAAEVKSVMKNCTIVHYDNLKMDQILLPFINNLDGFLDHIREKWGWKIDYDRDSRVIIGDENKESCVCPMVNHQKGTISNAICYCSEGFSEKMFSTVICKPVTAKVITSILRGDKTCKYKIEF
jgi:predicted hydrocarbon binding protein